MFTCKVHNCTEEKKTLSSLLLHFRDMHSNDFQITCIVDGCGLLLKSIESFRKHLFYKHYNFHLSQAGVSAVGELANDANLSKSEVFSSIEQGNGVSGELGTEYNYKDFFEDDSPSYGEKMYHELIKIISRKFNRLNLDLEYKYCIPQTHVSSILSGVRDLMSFFKLEFSTCLQAQIRSIKCEQDETLDFLLNDCISIENAMKITAGSEGIALNDLGYIAPVEYELKDDSDSSSEMSDVDDPDSGRLDNPDNNSDESSETSSISGHEACSGVSKTWQYVPLLKTLTQYLSDEKVFKSLKSEKQRHGILDKFNTGSMMSWIKNCKVDRFTVRVVIYTDEFTVATRIGAHQKRQKYLGIYGSINNIESKYATCQDSLFLVMLANYSLLEKYKYEAVLRPLIDDLKKLETEGLKVTVNGETHHLNGALAGVLGDNKSQHYIGNLTQCFSSGLVCRSCDVPYEDMINIHSESQCTLRTTETYKLHAEAVLQDPTLASVYGVKGKSVFHELESFHPVNSLVQDLLHDIEEGFIVKNVIATVRGLIKNKVVSFKTINRNLGNFQYDVPDKVNILKAIPKNVKKKRNASLPGTAAEKRNLFHILTLAIGDLVPVENQYWQLHLLANQICSILFAPSVRREWLGKLRELVQQHHELWQSLPQNIVGNFSCKLHYVVHSASWIEKVGPLPHLDCKKYERFHQFLKRVSLKSNNYINPALTMAVKYQKRRCVRISGGRGILSSNVDFGGQKMQMLALLSTHEKGVLSSFFSIDCSSGILTTTSKLCIDGQLFKPGLYVILDIVNDTPVFFKVLKIYNHEGKWGIYGRLTYVSEWDDHFHAFSLHCNINDINDFVCISPLEVIPPQTLAAYEIGERTLIKLRHLPVAK